MPGAVPRGITSGRFIPARQAVLHEKRMMETLGIHTNGELTHCAIKHGLVEF